MLPAGTVIDEKYQIVGTVGLGGFGAVYKATQLQFERSVAIKLLNTTLLHEPDGPARFEREARAIDSLKHKNIISIYGYGSFDQAPYMVMEMIDGKSLQAVMLEEGKLPPRRALAMIKQVFEALSAAHASGVIHRDLKPSNIMLLQTDYARDVVKMIDFGLAKLMPGYGVPGQKLTETGYALGSCEYMPPEQARGGPIDGRADIYSAGCILYQMLAGQAPFSADDNVALMYKHIREQPEPLHKFIPQSRLTTALKVLVANCMAKSVEHRYQNVAEALSDIAAIEQDAFDRVTPLSAAFSLPSYGGLRKAAVVTLVLLSSAALGCYIPSLLESSSPPSETESAANNSKLLFARNFDKALKAEPREEGHFLMLQQIYDQDKRDHLLNAKDRFDLICGTLETLARFRQLTPTLYEKHKAMIPPLVAEATSAVHDPAFGKGGHFDSVTLAELLVNCGFHQRADEMFRAAASQHNHVSLQQRARYHLAGDMANQDDLKGAQKLAQLNAEAEFGDAYSVYHNWCLLADLKFLRGDLPGAQAAYDRATEVSRVVKSSIERPQLGYCRIAYRRGQYQKALQHAREAINVWKDAPVRAHHTSAEPLEPRLYEAAALAQLKQPDQAAASLALVTGDGKYAADTCDSIMSLMRYDDQTCWSDLTRLAPETVKMKVLR